MSSQKPPDEPSVQNPSAHPPKPRPRAPRATPTNGTIERVNDHPAPGMLVLIALVGMSALAVYAMVRATADGRFGPESLLWMPAILLLVVVFVAVSTGFLILQPNTAAAFTLFGSYKSTIRQSGFFWVNPFYRTQKVSLRVENFNTDKLKVNDLHGNPIEIGAVITYRVGNVARAVFDVEGYQRYIQIQSEMALRDVASTHAYDSSEGGEVSLLGNSQVVSDLLRSSMEQHVAVAGIEILDIKLMHLAYAPEIASVMLRRQQARAVIQARELLVEGAITMVRHTLDRLKTESIVDLTTVQRASLTTNMMTVLVSQENAHPVIQLGHAES